MGRMRKWEIIECKKDYQSAHQMSFMPDPFLLSSIDALFEKKVDLRCMRVYTSEGLLHGSVSLYYNRLALNEFASRMNIVALE